MRYLSIITSLIFGLGCLWIASSQWGIGYDPDSIIYEDVAESVFAGYGISRFDFATGDRYPMTNFPPMYPLVLGILAQIFGTVAGSARLLNTALWGLLWLIVYQWIRRDHQSHTIAWAGASLLMFNLFIFQVFGTSWSEPLFLVLGFSGLWLVVSYQQDDKWRYLIGAGVLFASAILTRYAGVALVATASLMLLVASDKTWRKRLLSIVILGMVSGFPLLIWLLRNISLRGDVANRDVGLTLVGLPQLETAIQTVGSWLLPIPELTVNLVVIGLMSLLILWTFARIYQSHNENDLVIRIMRWWIVIYLLFIVTSFTLLDPRIPFNYRILLPAWVGIVILLGRWLALNWSRLGKIQQMVWRIAVIVLLCLNALLSLNWSDVIRQSGQQYSGAIFQKSDLIQDLHDNPSTTTLYTNNNFLFHYLTDQPADTLPFANDTDFDAWVASRPDEPIQIIFFHALSQRDWTSIDQLENSLPVTLIENDTAVSIYQLERP